MTPTAPDDRRRDFPSRPTARGRRSFAESWWGNAWVEALEGPTRSATGRLARGRTYARAGNVGAITVTPGRATAHVQGSQPRPYRTAMDIPTLTQGAWDILLDAAAAQAGHLAALLDRDMPTTLADTAAQAGVHLLPRPHELTPHCSCPDWGDPCKHAAALYYQVARLLDHDPFVLLLLRGRGESELLADLHRRNAAPTTAPPPPGVPARKMFAAARAGLPPLPAPPPPVDHPGPVPELTSRAAPAPGLDPAALRFLAADTATRARQMLNQALAPAPAHPQDLTPTTLSTDDPRPPRRRHTPRRDLHPAVLERAPHPRLPHPGRPRLAVRRGRGPGDPRHGMGPGPGLPARRARGDQTDLGRRAAPGDTHHRELAHRERARRPTAPGHRRAPLVPVPQEARHVVASRVPRPGRHDCAERPARAEG
ncbi:SWIM zinc finger family protein [Streptomyces sp. bgisy060]|uniref:SWIM zinc finger family protein n=1 Tax=Streptomyces sp. bgisy060 TaxID=3413775 RepID=UPI003EBE1069